jgi:hypothetical protein
VLGLASARWRGFGRGQPRLVARRPLLAAFNALCGFSLFSRRLLACAGCN